MAAVAAAVKEVEAEEAEAAEAVASLLLIGVSLRQWRSQSRGSAQKPARHAPSSLLVVGI